MIARQDAVFCWENLVDRKETLISVEGTDNTDFPVENLREPELDLVFRSSSLAETDVRMVFDFGAVKDWQVLALPLHNGRQAADVITVQKSNNGSSWTDVAIDDDMRAVDVWPNRGEKRNMYVLLADVVQASRYVRATPLVSGHPDGYFETARACIGPIRQPGVNFDWGFQMGALDHSQLVTTLRGTPHALVEGRARTHRYTFDKKLTDDEAEQFGSELQYALGTAGDLLAVPYPHQPSRYWWRNIWGKASDFTPDATHAVLGRWSFGFRLTERLA